MTVDQKQIPNSEWDLLTQAAQLFRDKKFDESGNIFRQVLKLNQNNAHSLHGIAAIALERKRYDEAERFCQKALRFEKNVGDFYFTLGSVDEARGRLEGAINNYQSAVKLTPGHLPALLRLGEICRNQGAIYRKADMLNAALNFYNRALAISADVDTYQSISYIYSLLGQHGNAIQVNEACLKRHPESPAALVNLASLYDMAQRYEEALHLYDKVIEIDPEKGEHYANKANTLKNLGRLDEAIIVLKKGLEISPDKANIHHALLLTMVYAASVSPEDLMAQSILFGEKIANPLYQERKFKNNKNQDRKLRIGFVSPDFRDHAVSFFLSPIYYADKENFEIYAYSKNVRDDDVTAYIKDKVDQWRDIQYMDDEKAAEQIFKDKIDILVDVAGHTAHNGLLIFARKPAPIQVTWLGYPATTGMKAMDYRFTDSFAEPDGMTEKFNTEKLWRLPRIFCAFTPPKNSPDVIDHPPFEDNGYITFGCFNNFTKVTDPVLKIWSKILQKIPEARLLLEIPGIENETILTEVKKRLENLDLPLDRVDMKPRSKANQYVLYNKIDIALDPFPCNGGTTTMDTLWMGVPLVTLAGKHFGSRMGVTLLSNAGLQEMIADTEDQYIALSIELANDRKRLKDMRANLRNKVLEQPLMDQKGFAKDMENAFREMWKIWVTEST